MFHRVLHQFRQRGEGVGFPARIGEGAAGLQAGSIVYAMFVGAALGLVAYGTYDLTNLSVVEGFNLRIALIDLVWGTVLSGATAALVVAVTSKIFTK